VGDADNPLRLIYSVPVPWEFKESFEARFGLRLIEAYGRTESNLNICCHLNEETPSGSCGRASERFDVSIRDENGVEVPRGVAGEIWARAKEPNTMMIGYVGPPELTAQTMHGNWMKSGDRAYMDDQGYVFFVDRIKDAIRRRGENISSVEVERVLNGHPSIAEVAVVPVKADVGEDEVKAVVVLKPGFELAPEALLEFAYQSLPYFMVPRFIEFKAELPRTPTMRVKKVDLREEGCTQATWDCEKAGLRITRRGLERIIANGPLAHG
jgi:crotonobetaine/carnitine-CoA ligase